MSWARPKPKAVAEITALGSELPSMAATHAASLASGVGRAARARAALSRPVAVLSALRSASTSASSASPALASAVNSVHRMSWSRVNPSMGVEPSNKPRTAATSASEEANEAHAPTSCNCASLPGAAPRAVARRPSLTATFRPARFTGAEYVSVAVLSCMSSMRSRVESVSPSRARRAK